MRRFWLLFLCLPFFSCQYFLSKEERVDRMVDKKMAEIDLNNVDQYPLFKNCDETVSKEEQQQCFVTEIMLHFKSVIEELNFESKTNLEDTLWVDLKVDEQGYMTIKNILQNCCE